MLVFLHLHRCSEVSFYAAQVAGGLGEDGEALRGGGGQESSCRERMGAGGRQAEVGSWGWNQKAGEGGSGGVEETEVSDYE